SVAYEGAEMLDRRPVDLVFAGTRPEPPADPGRSLLPASVHQAEAGFGVVELAHALFSSLAAIGRNCGMRKPPARSSKTTSTARSTLTRAGSTPTMFVIICGPSSRRMTART